MLREHLSHAFEKWKSNAGLYNEMETLRKEVAIVKYSDTGAFDLKKFNGRKFTNRIKLCASPEGLWENHSTYSFNKAGLPVIKDMQHVRNKETWSGYFVYTPEETRYVEFDHRDFIATSLEWVEWCDGKKRSWNRIRFQYGASTYLTMDVSTFVEDVMQNKPGSLIWSCEMYKYDAHDDRIEKAVCFYHSPGWGVFEAKKIYTWSADGKLEIIRRETISPDNTVRKVIEFSRSPKGETLKSLTEELTERISTTIFQSLQEEKGLDLIMQTEMFYKAVESYIPWVRFGTEAEVEKFENSGNNNMHERFFGTQCIKHTLQWEMDEETEQLYTRFFDRITDAENWKAGEDMMCLIANKLNAKAADIGKPHFSDNFFSYPIDYELDASELEKTLLKCGISKNQIARWMKTCQL